MKRQHSIRLALRALEAEGRRYDRRGGLSRQGDWQEKMLVEAAIAAARRIAGQPATPPTMSKVT